MADILNFLNDSDDGDDSCEPLTTSKKRKLTNMNVNNEEGCSLDIHQTVERKSQNARKHVQFNLPDDEEIMPSDNSMVEIVTTPVAVQRKVDSSKPCLDPLRRKLRGLINRCDIAISSFTLFIHALIFVVCLRFCLLMCLEMH